MGAHIEVIQITLLNTGFYTGSLNPELIKEFGMIMAKYGVRHVEVLLVPCKAEQVIRFEPIKKEDGKEKDEEKAAEEDDVLKK
jgi:hypothetical protein